MTAGYDYLIVGGGMAADAAARGIRELDPRGSIGILSADVDPPYTRPALTKKLWTDPDFTWEQVPLATAEDTGADVRLETVVTGVDRVERAVSLDDGSSVRYGKLLLATGGVPHRVEAPTDERIIHFRSADDYRRLRASAREGMHAIVVGGGYIGPELAAALVQNGVRVTLAHPDAVLGGAVFPASIADRYERAFVTAGVDVRGGVRVERVRTESEGLVVELDDGTAIGGDLVVVGFGVSPATELAEQAGIAVDDGVRVDARLRTSDDHIWAAGDIARYPDEILGPSRVEHVDNAREMGRAAGRSMAGDEQGYRHTPYFYSEVFGLRWEAVGDVDASLETLEDWVEPQQRAVVYYLDQDAPVGVLLWRVEHSRGGAAPLDDARDVLAHPPARREELIGRI